MQYLERQSMDSSIISTNDRLLMAGGVIRSMRKANGLTQEGLAMNTGIGRSRLSRIESRQVVISVDELIVLSEYFSVTPNDLLGYTTTDPELIRILGSCRDTDLGIIKKVLVFFIDLIKEIRRVK